MRNGTGKIVGIIAGTLVLGFIIWLSIQNRSRMQLEEQLRRESVAGSESAEGRVKQEVLTQSQKVVSGGYTEAQAEGLLDMINKRAAAGDSESLLMLGLGALMDGNYLEAKECLTQVAEKGDMVAQVALGYMYGEGKGVEQDYTKAVQYYTKAAEAGSADAALGLALLYFEGKGVLMDESRAVELLEESVEGGNMEAAYFLGTLYFDGKGVEEDQERAFELAKQAAEGGNAEAENFMGSFYSNKNDVVDENYEEAVKWYKLAAEQGNSDAQANLGSMYYRGVGVERNYDEAKKWLELVVDDSVGAQELLALMYFHGEGVVKDYAKSLEFAQRSANSGRVNGQLILAMIYYTGGEGFEPDLEQAKYWFGLAAEQGDEDARFLFEKLSSKDTANVNAGDK